MSDTIRKVDNPYEAPRVRSVEPFVEPDPTGTRTYERDPGALTAWLKGLLWAYLVLHAVSIVSNAMQLALLRGGEFSEEAGAANDLRQGAIGVLQFAFFVATAILFLKWVARSHRNVRGFGATGLTYSPNYAAGSFFIPVLNLWRPYQAMKELWQASRRPPSWRVQPGSPVLGCWWTLWIVNNLIGQVAFRLGNNAKQIDDFINVTYLAILSDVFDIFLTLAAFTLVGGIDRLQRSWIAGTDLETGSTEVRAIPT